MFFEFCLTKKGCANIYDVVSFSLISRQCLGFFTFRRYLGLFTFHIYSFSVLCLDMQETFAGMISDAGFQKVEYENLVGGVVAIHSGLKI